MRGIQFITLFASAVLVSTAAAQPVIPTALDASTQGPYTVVDFYSAPLSSAQWFTFSLGGPTAVDIDINRTSAPPDLVATLYAGDITGADATALAGGPHVNVYISSFGPLSYIDFQDDTEDDLFGGPFGDPRFTTNLDAGTYSLVVTTLQGAGDYTITSNVPEPTSLALLALSGLALIRRR